MHYDASPRYIHHEHHHGQHHGCEGTVALERPQAAEESINANGAFTERSYLLTAADHDQDYAPGTGLHLRYPSKGSRCK